MKALAALVSVLLVERGAQSFGMKSGTRLSSIISRSATTSKAGSTAGIEPTDLFSTWAQTGRDEVMAAGHEIAVAEMMSEVEPHLPMKPFRFLDIGCGNGWVARRISAKELCADSVGIDGAVEMIKKAKAMEESEGTGASFEDANILEYVPQQPFDVCFSMEVLYYLREKEVKIFLTRLHSHILSKGGIFVLGLDHFEENLDCHGWADLNNTRMLLWSESTWKAELENAGFEVIKSWRAAEGRPDIKSGTLAFICRAPL